MGKIGLPDITVEFIQKAVSAVTRSERGVLALIVYDSHTTGTAKKLYKYESEIKAEEYDSENYKAIKRAFLTNVNKVYVIVAPETHTDDMDEELAVLDTIKFNYVCVLNHNCQQELANYIRQKNSSSAGKKYIAVVENATVADSKYIINIKGDSVTEQSGDITTIVPMYQYLPRIASVLCNLPLNRSITYYDLPELSNVDRSYIDSEHDENYWTNEGYLLLLLDEEKVKVGRGVNSLVTFTSTDTEDMRKIIIVESMNLIIEDIYNTFKDYYVGKYKNSYDNQVLFISAVNSYFRSLAGEEILDPEFDNQTAVDVAAQREAWVSIGHTEAEDWSETKVKNMTFKSYVFLAGQVKILDCIEDLKFTIYMD